jgi:hypothetical protein
MVLNFGPIPNCRINVGDFNTFFDAFGARLKHNFIPVKSLVGVSDDK